MECGRLEAVVYHGHDMSNRGAYGHLWDRFVSRLSLERVWKHFAKVDKSVWIIFGHTTFQELTRGAESQTAGGGRAIRSYAQAGQGYSFRRKKILRS